MEHVVGMRQKAAIFGALFFGGFALGGLLLVAVCESWPRFWFALLTAPLLWCAVRWPLCMVGVEGTNVVVRNTLRTHRIPRAEVVAVDAVVPKPPAARATKFRGRHLLLIPLLLALAYVGFDIPDVGPRSGVYVRTARRRCFVSAAEGMSEAEQEAAAAHLRARLALTAAVAQAHEWTQTDR